MSVYTLLKAWLEDCSQNSKKDIEERVYSPYVYLPVGQNSYTFLGLVNTNGTVPQPLFNDPALKFAPVAILFMMLARFSDGPDGPVDLVMTFKFNCLLPAKAVLHAWLTEVAMQDKKV